MRLLLLLGCLCLTISSLEAQFTPTEKGLTIMVTDGTDIGKNSNVQPPNGETVYVDPIQPLGMSEAVQAGAFIDRPLFGVSGFLLVFCVNDSIGGEQGSLVVNGVEYKGIYRLIRQKLSPEEEIPNGMGAYRLSGTVYFLGISYALPNSSPE
ncbi:MAG: hypothetical protein AAF985_22325 [Bacteroidota bacterium]